MTRPQFDFSTTEYRPSAKILLYSGDKLYQLQSDLIAIARSKQMGQASGQWTVQLVDRIGTDGLTWQQRAKVGDYIEIYEGNAPNEPQIVLRGFVINAQRSFDIQGTGGPTRYTQLAGLDMGYVVQANQVRYLWPFDPTAIVANQYQLDSNFGIKPTGYTPTKFFNEVITKIVNNTGVKQMQSQIHNGTPPYFATQCDLPDQYQINTISIQAFTGQYWNLLSYFASAPFSELFYVDLPKAPMFYYRQPPYRDLDGSYLGVFKAPSALLPTITVKLADKKSHALGKSANEMYAFYMTYSDLVPTSQQANFNFMEFFGGAASSDQNGGSITNSVGVNNPSNPIYDKAIEARYGFRQLSVNTPFISALTQGFFANVTVPMNTWMYRAFRHNDEFESGTITVHGDPNITIGRYVHVPEWGMDFYVTGVTDNFVQYQTWTMDLQVIRGYAYGSNTKSQPFQSVPQPTPPPPPSAPSSSGNSSPNIQYEDPAGNPVPPPVQYEDPAGNPVPPPEPPPPPAPKVDGPYTNFSQAYKNYTGF